MEDLLKRAFVEGFKVSRYDFNAKDMSDEKYDGISDEEIWERIKDQFADHYTIKED